jgi:CubicO group peptidase (beta-lactamase class C family)
MASGFEWQAASPEEGGLISDRLEGAWKELEERGTKTFLVARGDQILFERYAGDFDAGKKHYTASLAKAIVGGLSLMVAMDDGLIGPDDLACEYVPQWKADPLKAKITIRHLAAHSSGIENAELSEEDREQARAEGRDVTEDHMSLPGWKGAFWRQEPDPFTLSRDEAPVIFEPGSAYDYSNPGMGMLAYTVTVALKGTEWLDIRTLLQERIFEPIGLAEDDWAIGYGTTFEIDGLPLVANWGGGSFTARAVARIGRLLLNGGAWEGQQLIGPAVVREALAYAGTPVPVDLRGEGDCAPGSGLGWWSNLDRIWEKLPGDAFAGAGAGNQILLGVPSKDLIIVRNGAALDRDPANKGFWRGVVDYLFDPVVDSFVLQPPYPASRTITGITWDPSSQVLRLARGEKRKDGSDNWPMTWADDGNLYTAYGDGYGFEPQIEKKLSMGLGVIMGGPEDFVAMNIRSRTGEFEGPGPKGEKSSGLLMVEGVLYMWVRNADREGKCSRLGWSTDHSKNWSWCDWVFKEFGHPTFINFGQNYAGARDEYVYIVSHDNPSAYDAVDSFVLMRVLPENLKDREGYEFFWELDGNGQPVWSRDIVERGPVFTHPGQGRRSSISYNAGLGRYLWWQQLTTKGADTRFDGGFSLYEAPEPWGPWSTAFYTERWDIGPGDLGCFPTKWMSEDGKTIYMVFSSEDNFTVRRAVLEVAE